MFGLLIANNTAYKTPDYCAHYGLKMKEQDFESSIEATSRPEEPRFDDERTVLTARPVVPLEKINSRLTHRRRWFLGGAFALAMMLGAASALLASYLKLRNVPVSAPEVSAASTELSGDDLAAAPLPVAEAVVSEPAVIESMEEPETTSPAPRTQPIAKRRATLRRDSEQIQPPPTPQLSEEDELERIREAVLIDEWQERRARRAARRERRSRIERYNHRDLSNLDEIFEGRRRP